VIYDTQMTCVLPAPVRIKMLHLNARLATLLIKLTIQDFLQTVYPALSLVQTRKILEN